MRPGHGKSSTRKLYWELLYGTLIREAPTSEDDGKSWEKEERFLMGNQLPARHIDGRKVEDSIPTTVAAVPPVIRNLLSTAHAKASERPDGWELVVVVCGWLELAQ